MKYNAHIYLHRLSLWSLQVVKLVFSFCTNAKFEDIAGIVNHHYHIFQVPRRFYSVNKSCSIVFQLHMITDYVNIVYRVTPGKINWCQTRLGNTQRVGILQFVCIIPRPSGAHFHTLYWKNIWEPRGDRVIMKSVLLGPRYDIFPVY